jgi:hypothetical protein
MWYIDNTMTEKQSHPIYDLRCNVRPEKLCPAKVEIVGAATGDPSGSTQIDNQLTEFIVQGKFLEQDAVASIAEATGRHGDIEDVCPVRPAMNESVVRRSVLGMLRGGFHRARGRQND